MKGKLLKSFMFCWNGKTVKIAIMQPYFFPYLGYFSLIKNTDKFILLDTVQFIRHGWIERNRILKQNEGWLYFKVPLIKHSRGTLINDIQIDNNLKWKQKILSQIQLYKRVAPHYFKVHEILTEIFENEFNDIVTLNESILKAICNYLELDATILIFSKSGILIDTPKAPDEWALNICKAIGNVTEYWNPPGGKSFFDKSKYKKANINLKFQEINLSPYNQNRKNFESGLSIIDVMMFNNPEKINKMLDHYELIV